jgi:hypothetical protein
MNAEWRCERCQRVLGEQKGGRMHLRPGTTQFIVDGGSSSVLAICRCRTMGEWRPTDAPSREPRPSAERCRARAKRSASPSTHTITPKEV